MNARDLAGLLGAVVVVATVTTIVTAESIPGSVDAVGRLFVNSIGAMMGVAPGERILR